MEEGNGQGPLFFLNDDLVFPPLERANEEGLLAVGGDLSPERLVLAYQSGIFPWFDDDALILWWSPDPRMVLFPEELRVSKSMRKVLRSGQFTWTQNACFGRVVEACAKIKRRGQQGTWITDQMQAAYSALFKKGIARSFEVWEGTRLVGGGYGVDLGHVFCGESMFSEVPNASKYGLIRLVETLSGHRLIDCQVYTAHLASLGARQIPRADFIRSLQRKD